MNPATDPRTRLLHLAAIRWPHAVPVDECDRTIAARLVDEGLAEGKRGGIRATDAGKEAWRRAAGLGRVRQNSP